MKYFLNCRSLIKVAVIIVVMAFMAGQVTDTYAGKKCRDGHHQLDRRGKCKRCKKIVKVIINNNGNSVDCEEITGKLDEIQATLDQCIEPADCDVCPPPEGVEKSWVPKTGQTECYAADGAQSPCTDTGQDGDKLAGITWPNPRFTDNGNGTITDNLTCLIWDKNANRFGQRNWSTALSDCNTLSDASSDLTDSSGAGDWRLPNVRELQSLIHYGFVDPALPNTAGTGQHGEGGDTFNNVPSPSFYWSSTTLASDTVDAWGVTFFRGFVVSGGGKGFSSFVWCVRGGS